MEVKHGITSFTLKANCFRSKAAKYACGKYSFDAVLENDSKTILVCFQPARHKSGFKFQTLIAIFFSYKNLLENEEPENALK